MAVKTYLTNQTARQLTVRDKTATQGLNDSSNYGNVQFLEITDCDSNTSTVLQAHIILSAGAPAKLFWQAPIGSLLIDVTNGVLYIKRVLATEVGNARYDDWSSLDMTVQAGD
jgi:hypothetical protein